MARDTFDTRLEAEIPALRRYAFALARDRDAADDLVQDCLERALARRMLRRPDGELRAWLFAILRNLYVDTHRARLRHGAGIPLDDAPEPAYPADQERALEARDALAALALMPEEHRSLLLLIGVEDLTYEEAGRVLDIPVGTVMSRLARARARLRSLMERGTAPLLRRVK